MNTRQTSPWLTLVVSAIIGALVWGVVIWAVLS